MKKLLSSLLIVAIVVFASSAFAQDRYTPMKTSGALTTDGQNSVRNYGIDIYRIMFNGTAATSGLAIYDSADAGTTENCVLEIYEATDGEGHYIDFGDNPLKLDTGCQVQIFDAAVVLHYR